MAKRMMLSQEDVETLIATLDLMDLVDSEQAMLDKLTTWRENTQFEQRGIFPMSNIPKD